MSKKDAMKTAYKNHDRPVAYCHYHDTYVTKAFRALKNCGGKHCRHYEPMTDEQWTCYVRDFEFQKAKRMAYKVLGRRLNRFELQNLKSVIDRKYKV